jgi:hypothetical protein
LPKKKPQPQKLLASMAARKPKVRCFVGTYKFRMGEGGSRE